MALIVSFTQLAPQRRSHGVVESTARSIAPHLFCHDRVTGGIHLLMTSRSLYKMCETVFQRIPRWPLRYPHGFYFHIIPEHTIFNQFNQPREQRMRMIMWAWEDGICSYTTHYVQPYSWETDNGPWKQGPVLDWEDASLLGWQWCSSQGYMKISYYDGEEMFSTTKLDLPWRDPL